MKNDPTTPCRVCGAQALQAFRKQILQQLDVAYYECPDCGHVQSETPYWLQDSYGKAEWNRDVGLVSRLLDTFHLTFALAWRLGISPADSCVDFGGGTGLFARLCRDYGLSFYNYEPYAEDLFAYGFSIRQPMPAKLVTAFEVVEHFTDPLNDFSQLFAFEPDMVFFSTRLYEGQGEKWWYFLENGQHVAVYTPKSLELIAEKFGYHFYTDFDFHLFSRSKQHHRIVKKLRGCREKFALKYRKRHGSKIEDDLASLFPQLGCNDSNSAKPPEA
jgi:hypothetical protein